MENRKHLYSSNLIAGNILTIVAVFVFYCVTQAQNCYDINFETGTLNGWTTTGNAQLVSAGTDLYGGFPVRDTTGNFSVKLGSETDNTPSSISKSFTVNASNPIITYAYAMVLDGQHDRADASKITLDVFDNNNNPISCAKHVVYGEVLQNNTLPPGFFISNQGFGVIYRKWTYVSLDLTAYINQQVTLKASVNWCVFNVHFAYAYLDFDCASFPILQDTSCNNIGSLLVAPQNFDSYSWAGPGIISGHTNDSVYVNQPGTYNVTMTSINNCVVQLSKTITYAPLPVIATATGGGAICVGDSITLSAGGGASYLWWGTTNTTSTRKVSPSIPTTYIVEARDQRGCSDTASVRVSLHPPPTANFTPTDVCIGQAINFNNLSSVQSGNITSQVWNFGDSSPTSTAQNPSHTYSSVTTYQASLTVTTNNGCKDTVTKNIIVHPLPNAAISSVNACAGSIVAFNDASTLTTPDVIQTWAWNFGDGSPIKNNKNTSHLYPNAGTYPIQLIITSNFGCKDTAVKSLTINPNPAVSFTANDTVECSPLCVEFQSVVANAGNNPSYQWNYGDNGALGNSANGNHCYINNTTQPLDFTVSLTVTSDSGCTAVITKNDYVTSNPNPTADFIAQPNTTSIMNPEVTITNLSSDETVWSWNFGDLSTSTIENPEPHNYADTGTYTISLIVNNNYSCYDTAYRTITIEPDWAFFIPNVFSPNNDNINDTYQGYGYGLLEYNMSIFDRWGNHIYETDNYNSPWDGRANYGKEIAQQDVYIYQFVIRDIHGYAHTYRGTVTLVR